MGVLKCFQVSVKWPLPLQPSRRGGGPWAVLVGSHFPEMLLRPT